MNGVERVPCNCAYVFRTDGWPVLITLSKQNQHRWDLLVTDPKKFKGVMDKDWSREDPSFGSTPEASMIERSLISLLGAHLGWKGGLLWIWTEWQSAICVSLPRPQNV